MKTGRPRGRPPSKNPKPKIIRRPNSGQPPFEPTDEMRLVVAMKSAAGFRQEDICAAILNKYSKFPIDLKTFRVHFKEEFARGREIVAANIHGGLIQQALVQDHDGLVAKMFYLKTRCGFRETIVNEHMGKDGAAIRSASEVQFSSVEQIKEAVQDALKAV